MEAMTEQLTGNGSISAVQLRAASTADECSRAGIPGPGLNVSASRQSIPMEALTEQLTGNGSVSAVAAPASLAAAIGVVRAAAAAAPAHLALASHVEAADYAGLTEELSRTVEYLQILSAGAVDRTRTQAIADAAATRAVRSWTTGWESTGIETGIETVTETDAAWPAGTGTPAPASGSPADDGCKNTAEFLRLRLRIGGGEAKRRLHLAHAILPETTLTGDTLPPAREHLAAALTPTSGTTDPGTETLNPLELPAGSGPVMSSRAGTIISATLDRLTHHTTAETLDRIEHDLTRAAATTDPDFLARLARRWADTLDADGTEPTEEALRHTQGAFIRKPRHGLHHLEIFATTDQYEHFATIMNAATNPRTHPTTSMGNPDGTRQGGRQDTGVWQDNNVDLDRRTRPQKQLDGIITAFKAALTTNKLPTAGGNRPQIIATINYQDLLPHLPAPETGTDTGPASTGTGTGADPGPGKGSFIFTGPAAAATIRKLACDADIIPALLGTHGEILDLGRKTRLFTPAQRLALTARDQGCTFPNCTIPAPWCEAHHITYWSHNGPTSTTNGVLLCSHHHHLIHKEQWTIHTTNGTPWFTPPRHIDPTQKPQQNHYFKPPPRE
ncbi:HNH endonuclease signature motif containing protein [[Micrococcus luteus] ATCC 49442]|uniref:HNH endonuclease signature motif containing protein n=1 Tax=[Micrococcus luteus] ATCC 49442 TaxID=2698727 RepID=UPI0013DD1480|nr:HNH endonuclease signature motif containing protein [[Micrococcus luteus] ATCC 49442]